MSPSRIDWIGISSTRVAFFAQYFGDRFRRAARRVFLHAVMRFDDVRTEFVAKNFGAARLVKAKSALTPILKFEARTIATDRAAFSIVRRCSGECPVVPITIGISAFVHAEHKARVASAWLTSMTTSTSLILSAMESPRWQRCAIVRPVCESFASSSRRRLCPFGPLPLTRRNPYRTISQSFK